MGEMPGNLNELMTVKIMAIIIRIKSRQRHLVGDFRSQEKQYIDLNHLFFLLYVCPKNISELKKKYIYI